MRESLTYGSVGTLMQQHGSYRTEFAQPINASVIPQPTPLAQPM